VPEQSAEELEQSVEVPENEMAEVEDGGAPTQGELRVYAKRRKKNEKIMCVLSDFALSERMSHTTLSE
jgi:hypothetical protein